MHSHANLVYNATHTATKESSSRVLVVIPREVAHRWELRTLVGYVLYAFERNVEGKQLSNLCLII